MIPKQPGWSMRFLLAAAAICAFAAPPTGVRAEEPSADGWDEVVRSIAEPPAARAAVRPWTRISLRWIGPPAQDSARLDIRFAASVTGFTNTDFVISCAPVTAACPEVAPFNTASAARFSVTLRMPRDYDGFVTVHIPGNVAENADGEGNLPSNQPTIPVDTRAPVFTLATINGDEVVIDFDENLNESAVPAVGDFAVSFTRSGNYRTRTVSAVEVSARKVFLSLESPVEQGDAVEVFYDDRGDNALRDRVGNRVFGGTWQAVNVTGTTRTGVPGAPRNLTAEADGPTAIDLDWLAPTADGGARITAYRIEVSENGGTSWSNLEARTSDTVTAYRDTDVDAGETRHYRVSAINFNGTGPVSNVARATTRHVLPGAPRRLTARARGTSAIELSWSAPSSSGSSPITGYRIESSPTGDDGSWRVRVANTRSTTYTHDRLEPGTTRHYRVRAITRAGHSEWSNTARATTEVTVPDRPTGLRVTPSGVRGSGQLLLTWSAPGDDGGSAITGYRIERSPNGNTGWIILVPSTNSTTTTYLDTRLRPATTWFYRVSAVNSQGTGPASSVRNAP